MHQSRFAIIGVFVAGVAVMVAGMYVVWAALDDLAETAGLGGAVSALGRLLLLGLACGAIAYTLVEFVKRMTPLRSWFNRRHLRVHGEPFRFHNGWDGPVYWGARIEEVTAQLLAPAHRRFGHGDHEGYPSPELVDYEIHLDAVQAEVSNRWVWLLRLAAAIAAGATAAAAAIAADGRLGVTLGAFAFGLVIGGPSAWLVRDFARFIDRRARY